MLAQLDRLGIPNGDRGEEAKGRTPGGTQGTYMDDPAGYVIQYITEGMLRRDPNCSHLKC